MHDLHLSEIWGWWEGETLRCCPCSSFQGIGMSFGGGNTLVLQHRSQQEALRGGKRCFELAAGLCRELWWPPTLLPSPSQGVFANALFPRLPLNSVQER